MAVNGNSFLIKVFDRNCRVGRTRQRKQTLQEWVTMNKNPERHWLSAKEKERLSAAWSTNESEEHAKLASKFSLNNYNVPEDSECEMDMDKINAALEELMKDPDFIEDDKKAAKRKKRRMEKSRKASSNLESQKPEWGALTYSEAQNHQEFQPYLKIERQPPHSSSTVMEKRPEISHDELLPLPSVYTEQERISQLPEVRETPSETQEQALSAESAEPILKETPCLVSSDEQKEDTIEIEKPISFRTYAKGNEQSICGFAVEEIQPDREFVRFFPIMPESARINCDSQDKSDDETAQLPSKTVKTNHSTLLFTKSSSPKERLKEKQNDYRGLADEADIESDDCKKKIFLRSFVKERPDPIAHNEPSSFEKDEIIVEGTTDDPTDPNCEWITLKLDAVAPEENDTLSAGCKRTPERKKRDFKSERDISKNCTRPKRRRLITDKKSVLAVAQVKREIDAKHRNFIERGHAWLEIQNEEVRPLPTFYTSERRLNNSRLGRIMGDQQDELFFAKKQI